MGRLGVVLGSNAEGPEAERLLAAARTGDALALRRHGGDRYVLPHRIDHEANMRLLLDEGCDRVLAICSVGSLRREIPAGSLACPDDFIALQAGETIFDDMRAHSTRGFDREWRAQLLAAAASGGTPLRDGGVYWQTLGPRFETPAEIRLLAAHADFVGMTMGTECVIAAELGLSYAALCVVDNMANGIEPEPLSVEALEGQRRRNVERLVGALEALLPGLAG